MPGMGYGPVNKSLPPRPRRDSTTASFTPAKQTPAENVDDVLDKFFAWADKMLTR